MFKNNKKEIETARLHFEKKIKQKVLAHLRMNIFRKKLTRIKIELTEFIFQRKLKLKAFQILRSKVEKRKEINKICKIVKGTNFHSISEIMAHIPDSSLDENDLKLIFALNYSRKNLLQKYFKHFKRQL